MHSCADAWLLDAGNVRLKIESERMSLSKQVRQATRSDRERDWSMSAEVKAVCVIIFVLTEFSHKPARVFLANCARSRHQPARNDAALDELVDACFAAMDVDAIMKCIVLPRRTYRRV